MPDDPPANASRTAEPVEPIEVCTVLTPSTPRIACSTFCAALSSASNDAPGSSFCDTVKVFWPLSPRKFVFMKGAAARVPPRMSTATSSVTQECVSVQDRIGR